MRIAVSWYSFIAIEIQTKTELSTRDWGIIVIGIIILLFRRMWTLGIWIRKAVEYFKWGLTSNPSRNMEDSDGEGDLNSENLAQEVSEEKTNILMIY